MNSLRKLRNTIKRPTGRKNIQLYIYTPLPGNKLGYIVEYRQRQFCQLFYYKYKENTNGTLTKYGYLISDREINNNSDSGGKGLWANKDKDCIFYQTVADKTQINLEHRWLNEIRARGRWEVPAVMGEDPNDEFKEWEDVMQHNTKVFISDNIQRRRVAEVLSNVENCCGMELDLSSKYNSGQKGYTQQPKTTMTQFEGYASGNGTITTTATTTATATTNTNAVNPITVEGRLRPNQLPRLTTISTTQFSIPSNSQVPNGSHKHNDSVSTTSSISSLPQHIIKNYITFTPPISPQTPPGTPVDASDTPPNSLLNINVRRDRQRQQSHNEQKSTSSNGSYDVDESDKATKDRPRKLVHLTHPKFSQIPPKVHIFDPEELLLFRDCRCDYCMIGDYNE